MSKRNGGRGFLFWVFVFVCLAVLFPALIWIAVALLGISVYGGGVVLQTVFDHPFLALLIAAAIGALVWWRRAVKRKDRL